MCGIAGYIDREGEPEMLRRMLDRIAHRGPDGEGAHFGDGFAMGMRRLSIIDLEGGAQPIWNEDKTIGVVFNGEIYNYRELRQELETRGHRFRSHSDTEVLVHLYEELGRDLWKRLRGMFAFCIFDRRRNTLLLARDHFGQKPLYYSTRGNRFAFASELKCLLALPWVERDLDSEAFLDYTTWLSLPPPRSHFLHIQKLPPASLMEVPISGDSNPVVEGYWQYDLINAPDLCEAAKATDALDAVLRDSVKLHLRADVPTGVLLSGGLDSRTVVTYAQELQNENVQTFTVGFGSADSELADAALTAREIRSRHHALELRAADLANNIDRVATLLDEPIGDPACFAVLKLCEMARCHVKVLLSGEGSDELFGGYESRYAGMLSTLGRGSLVRWLSGLLPNGSPYSPSRWQRFCARANSTPAGEVARLRMEGLPGDSREPRVYTSEQIQRAAQRAEQVGASIFRKQRDRLSALLAFDLDWQLPESLLQKADKMSMGASIELRTPFLDCEVASVAARIPSSLKLPPGGPGKLILRQTLAKKLNEPLNRPKKGFPVPLEDWFRGELREVLESSLFSSTSAVASHFDSKRLRRAWDDFQAEAWDGSRVFYALWLYNIWTKSLPK